MAEWVWAAVRAPVTPRYCAPTAAALFVLECVLVPAIILRVPYTEIDWRAYMQEVEGVLNGTTDYQQLRGDTGPLVYPAGFVYVYSLLYWVTSGGRNMRLAQWLFGGLYLLNLAVVLRIYTRISKAVHFPPILLLFLCVTAHRVHSIFVLRMFNDAVVMTILYIALLLMIENHWILACIVYSFAVSVKMNVILFAPGLLYLLLRVHGLKGTITRLFVCAAVQFTVGLPFLLTHPVSYISRAFDLGRVFLFKWTVNWRFLPESIFLSRWFHVLLLAGHVFTLAVFAYKQWIRKGELTQLLNWEKRSSSPRVRPQDVVWVLFTANVIGLCFSRSLHYQFYVWYHHTLPLLLHWTPLATPINMLILVLVEYCWNVYPSTTSSSLLLLSSHLVLLCGLFFAKRRHSTAAIS